MRISDWSSDVCSSDLAQPPAQFLRRERLLLVARREAGALGQNPDLQQMHRILVRGVILAVPDAGAGRHALHLAGSDDRAVAETVAMRERPIQHPGHDLHVTMRVGIERSEEHTSELQSLMRISYAVFCLKKKK